MLKKIISSLIAITIIMSVNVSAKTNTEELYDLIPEMTKDEINKTIKDTSIKLNRTENEIINKMVSEFYADKKAGEELQAQSNKFYALGGGGSTPTYELGYPEYNGDIFYEPATTFSVQHGHVGIYYTSEIIVESMPSDGVNKRYRSNKRVETGARIFTLSNVGVDSSDSASNWAYGEIGESYTYNFATNRTTGYYGAKNCSKLVWSAYMVTTGVDIDKDGGLGVYPRDILNYPNVRIYRYY